jgi:hypothetical protein
LPRLTVGNRCRWCGFGGRRFFFYAGVTMTALTQVPPVQPAPSAQPLQINAFNSAMNAASAVLNAGPDAIGKTLLSGIDNFSADEAQFRNTVAQAAAPESSQPTTTADGTPSADPNAPRKLTTAQAIQEGEAMGRRSMGIMMQTYNFALEAALVSNAASTFTGSVNTLIKTQ